jgi:hypothetical protein
MATSLDINDMVLAKTETCCPPIASSLELRAAVAEARAVAGLAVVRAMAWTAWAEDDGASYDAVYASVLRAVRETGLPLNEAQMANEVRTVAALYDASLLECPPGTV